MFEGLFGRGRRSKEDISKSREKMRYQHGVARDASKWFTDAMSASQLYEEHKYEQELRNSEHPVLMANFKPDETLEPIVREYMELSGKSVTFNFDEFPPEEVAAVRGRLDEIEQTYGDSLRTYLAPYTAIPNLPGAEDYYRWMANKLLRTPTVA